ncbi:MAG: hypothetical protein Q9159_000941 [Coniocarpon cinnabarinum]
MASVSENKRQSVGNRVATPKTPAGATSPVQSSTDIDQALAKAIGARVTLTTAPPHSQQFKGILFTADRITNVIAIAASANNSQPSDFHLIHTSRIASFQVDSRNPTGSTSFMDAMPSIGPVDLKEAETREVRAVTLEKEKEQRRKQGITPEAEDLFIAIERMLPIRWAGEKMVVNENVLITAPFRPENCQAPKGNDAGLARVKKTVENIWAKNAERASRSGTPQPPRKGG